MSMPAPPITRRTRPTGPAMPIGRMTRNTASAIHAAAAAPRRAKQRRGSRPERWRGWIVAEVTIAARVIEIGGDPQAATWPALIEQARAAGSSLGGIVECVASGVPAGWGAPVYGKLDAELAAAIMSVNAVKGVEIGAGFGAARARGEDNDGPDFAGGITGGIATGTPIVLRAAFKPPSSIAALGVAGRHDPCVAIRGAPVIEAMMALVLADHKLLHRAQCGDGGTGPC